MENKNKKNKDLMPTYALS